MRVNVYRRDQKGRAVFECSCQLEDAIPEADQRQRVAGDLRRDGFTFVGGGAAPAFVLRDPSFLSSNAQLRLI